MEEENQQQVQQVMKKLQRVTMKDPKKVQAGKRLAAINRKKREVKKREEQVQLERTTSRMNQNYGQPPNDHAPRLTSLRWIKSLLYYKNGQEEHK